MSSISLEEKQVKQLEKFFLEIRDKSNLTSLMDLENSDEIYIQNLKTNCEERLEDIKKILNGGKIKSSELEKILSDSQSAFLMIKDIFLSNNLLVE